MPQNATGCVWKGSYPRSWPAAGCSFPLQEIPSGDEGLHRCTWVMQSRRAWQVCAPDAHKTQQGRSNICWRCVGIGHFNKDCTTTLSSQDSDKKGKSSDTSLTIGLMSHMLTASIPMTDFTFKVIKEFVSSAVGNKKTTFCLRPPLTRSTKQPFTSNANQVVTPAMTAVTNTPATQVETRSATATTTPSPSTSRPASTTRVPHRMTCQTVALYGTRPRVNQPASSQTMVQLLEVINEVTTAARRAGVWGVEESPEQSQGLAWTYQPEVYLAERNPLECVEAVIHGLTRGATFLITIAGATFNALIDTVTFLSCISKYFYKYLMLPLVWQVFGFSLTSTSGSTLKPLGTVKCPFWLRGYSFQFDFIVCKISTRCLILGSDFIQKYTIWLKWWHTGKGLYTQGKTCW